MSALADIYDLRPLRHAARLAGALARPLDVVHPARAALAPLDAATSWALGSHPDLRAPFNRAFARALGVSDLPLGAAHLARIAQDPRSRLALLLVSAEADALARAAGLVAAAILHPSAVQMLLKAERARLGELLGDELAGVSLREAPVLHAPLGELDPGGILRPLLRPDLPLPEARERLAGFGLGALARYVGAVEADLAPLFARRLPPDAGPPGLAGEVTPQRAGHIVKLMQRRFERWRDSIG